LLVLIILLLLSVYYNKVDANGNVTRNDPVFVTATLDSFLQVFCPLAKGRKTRSAEDDIDNQIAYGFKVAVSNDGATFSKDDSIVIFDSTCVECAKLNGSIICLSKVSGLNYILLALSILCLKRFTIKWLNVIILLMFLISFSRLYSYSTDSSFTL